MDTQNYNPVNSGRGRGGRHRNHGHQQPGRHHHHHHHANHSGRGPRHERHNSVAGIRQYHDRLHPVIAQRYRNLKAKALRLQTGFQEILDCIEELIPSDEHMDWSFSPGTIVYVPVPHPSVNTLSKRVSSVSLTSTSSQISSNHHQDAIQSRSSLAAPGSLSNQPQTSESHTQPTINHHPVQSELVSTNDGYYPSWPPITVPLQSRDHTGTMPTAQVPLTMPPSDIGPVAQVYPAVPLDNPTTTGYQRIMHPGLSPFTGGVVDASVLSSDLPASLFQPTVDPSDSDSEEQ